MTELRTGVICSSKHHRWKTVATTPLIPLVAGLDLQAQLRLVHSDWRVLRTAAQCDNGIREYFWDTDCWQFFSRLSISQEAEQQILRSWTLVKQLSTLNT